MIIPETVTVTATVKGAEMPGEGDKDYKVGLDIPAFKSKYPTTVYVPLDVSLKKGASYSIELLQGKKAKEDYKGDLHWHFMWKWGGLRTQVSAPAPAEAPKGQEHAPGAAAGPSSEKPPLFAESMMTLTYGRTFNLGNYETERIDLQREFPTGTLLGPAYAGLQNAVEKAHAQARLTREGKAAPKTPETIEEQAPKE